MLNKYMENKLVRSVAEWAAAIVLAVLAYIVINKFIFGTAEISGPSMNPTLSHGDRVSVNKFAYVIGEPQKGEIIAFLYPSNPKDKLVKRIIGVGGDFIEIYENKFYINGGLLVDDFSSIELVSGGDMEFPLTVGEGEYFVLGDNRNNSKDSRSTSVGLITKKDIIGKLQFRFYPFDSIGFTK